MKRTSGDRYRPMGEMEAAQRQRPMAERSTHADDNSCVEVPFAARTIAKAYDGSDPFMRKMNRKSRHAAWVPSWHQATEIIARARKAQANS